MDIDFFFPLVWVGPFGVGWLGVWTLHKKEAIKKELTAHHMHSKKEIQNRHLLKDKPIKKYIYMYA